MIASDQYSVGLVDRPKPAHGFALGFSTHFTLATEGACRPVA
eukprot:COSAG02_NODE_38560_length_427_cov_1.698171_2_plen_41_part_01